MPGLPAEVDFLIVTALRVETDSVVPMIEGAVSRGTYTIGWVSRSDQAARYDVAVVEIGGMGTNDAQARTSLALSELHPRRVLLTGIAAGFPEDGVGYGDIIVPWGIVPYELAKIRELSSAEAMPSGLARLIPGWLARRLPRSQRYEPRAVPLPVSYGLWHAANTLTLPGERAWHAEIRREPRPDRTNGLPPVHVRSNSLMGCGEKIVGTELAWQRRYLREEFPRQAIGLEMESLGVLKSCHVTDTPFLVIKASQDPATAEKDAAGVKDAWRVYAAKAAAAFTVDLIRNFEPPQEALVLEVTGAARREARTLQDRAPKPGFNFKVSRASSYPLLTKRQFDTAQGVGIDSLLPSDAARRIALHGGGGTGKSRILENLMSVVIDAGQIPVLLNLKQTRTIPGLDAGIDTKEDIRRIVAKCSIPRVTTRDLERLASHKRLVVLVDGLNEVSSPIRAALIEHLEALDDKGRCGVVATDRLGLADVLEDFAHAAVDRLDPADAAAVYDQVFEAGAYNDLNAQLKKIYRWPFFLNLAITSRRSFTGSTVWSDLFQQFFLSQLRFTEAELDRVATATFETLDAGGHLRTDEFAAAAGHLFLKLTAAEVIGSRGGFEHDLWRDYLVSRYFSRNPGAWTTDAFDRATVLAHSPESLTMTVEQLPSREAKNDFLKAVYDWNYHAAADCIEEFRDTDPEARQLSHCIRWAVYGAVAEKRFDPVPRTRSRATDYLKNHPDDVARPYAEASPRSALVAHVTALPEPEPWFTTWKRLFTKPDGQGFDHDDLTALESRDSLVGWAAANLARRSNLDPPTLARIRQFYEESHGDPDRGTYRWRLVHALGPFPSPENVAVLFRALNEDTYHWVRYGAARSLMEIASRADHAFRDHVLSGLRDFVRRYNPMNLWFGRQLLGELIETSFIDNPRAGWREAVVPLLGEVVQKEASEAVKKQWTLKVKKLDPGVQPSPPAAPV